MDPGRQAEFFVEGRFELRQPLFSTEGVGSGDKNDLVSLFFRSTDDLFYGLGRDRRNRSNQSKRQPEYRLADESGPRSVHYNSAGFTLYSPGTRRMISFFAASLMTPTGSCPFSTDSMHCLNKHRSKMTPSSDTPKCSAVRSKTGP